MLKVMPFDRPPLLTTVLHYAYMLVQLRLLMPNISRSRHVTNYIGCISLCMAMAHWKCCTVCVGMCLREL